MELFLTSALGGVISSACVGILLTLFKVKLDQNAAAISEANILKFKNVESRINQVDEAVTRAHQKLNELGESNHRIELKVQVLTIEQKHAVENLATLRSEIEKHYDGNLGKVIRKP